MILVRPVEYTGSYLRPGGKLHLTADWRATETACGRRVRRYWYVQVLGEGVGSCTSVEDYWRITTQVCENCKGAA